MNEELINELNKFLKGIHMGGSTFKDYLAKAQDLELKTILVDILESFKQHEEAITHRIEQLGGDAADSVGMMGEIAEAWQELTLLFVDSDKEVCEKAIKAIDMGLKNGNKFIDDHKDMNETLLSDVKAVVDDYDKHLEKIKKISKKFS